MFSLLSRLALPTIAGGAFAVGLAAGASATVITYEKLITPGRERAAEARATRAAEKKITAAAKLAASQAKLEERDRLQRIHEAALSEFRKDLEERERRMAKALENSERLDREYSAKLAQAGRSCPLDAGAIRYLNGVRDKAGPR